MKVSKFNKPNLAGSYVQGKLNSSFLQHQQLTLNCIFIKNKHLENQRAVLYVTLRDLEPVLDSVMQMHRIYMGPMCVNCPFPCKKHGEGFIFFFSE